MISYKWTLCNTEWALEVTCENNTIGQNDIIVNIRLLSLLTIKSGHYSVWHRVLAYVARYSEKHQNNGEGFSTNKNVPLRPQGLPILPISWIICVLLIFPLSMFYFLICFWKVLSSGNPNVYLLLFLKILIENLIFWISQIIIHKFELTYFYHLKMSYSLYNLF